VIPYARFWAVAYALYVLWMCLRIRLVDAGYCVYIAHSLLIIVLAPWSVYRYAYHHSSSHSSSPYLTATLLALYCSSFTSTMPSHHFSLSRLPSS